MSSILNWHPLPLHPVAAIGILKAPTGRRGFHFKDRDLLAIFDHWKKPGSPPTINFDPGQSLIRVIQPPACLFKTQLEYMS